MRTITLIPEQRHFFQQIAALAFVNPFSHEREKADFLLLKAPCKSLSIDQRIEQLQSLLAEKFEEVLAINTFHLNAIQESEKECLKLAWLFYQYHDFQHRFNQFILEQKQHGDEPLVLAFGGDLIDRFHRAGFNDADTAKYIALFYQLCRGFYFIDSSLSGDSPSMMELRMRLWNNIFTFDPHWYLAYLLGRMEEFSTLLLGPTGSGKSLVAHAIGCSGFIPFDLKRRRFQESFTRSFQAINLAQFPSSLLESELFGHKKGAFTGAIDHHPGVFARCSAYGAVFIDEIGDIDLPTQVNLLNVMQERTFSPVGSHEKLRFSGRVISATNRDIQTLRHQGSFRDDLYYRLCSDVIVVPGLQQRLQENPEELKILIAGLIKRVIYHPDDKLITRIEKKIRSTIPHDYAWPGNVRELEQCIRRICLTGGYQVNEPPATDNGNKGFCLPDKTHVSAQQVLQNYCRYLYRQHGSYEAVARITQLDRRTVKKYIV